MTPFSMNIRGRLLEFTEPVVMGILNVTPDSFYADSRVGPDRLVARASAMLAEGAAIIDVGGCSTRPGCEYPSVEDEMKRVVPAIAALRRAFPEALISIDTFRGAVAQAAVEAGADIINDISGMTCDLAMREAVESLHVPYILTDATDLSGMAANDAPAAVVKNLQRVVRELTLAGVCDIIVDPGIGFGKTLDQNYAILANLQLFEEIGCPVLIGVSRKSMITKLLDIKPEEALEATVALNAVALMHGAAILRVHDVKAAAQTAALISKLKKY